MSGCCGVTMWQSRTEWLPDWTVTVTSVIVGVWGEDDGRVHLFHCHQHGQICFTVSHVMTELGWAGCKYRHDKTAVLQLLTLNTGLICSITPHSSSPPPPRGRRQEETPAIIMSTLEISGRNVFISTGLWPWPISKHLTAMFLTTTCRPRVPWPSWTKYIKWYDGFTSLGATLRPPD